MQFTVPDLSHKSSQPHGAGVLCCKLYPLKFATMQSERGRIMAALNADQLIGTDYSKLSLGVQSRYKAAYDSDALQCDAEPLVSAGSYARLKADLP